MYKYSGFMANFKQGNGEIHPVTINPESKKKFGSLGNMWIVSFSNGTSHYMTAEDILNATGVNVNLRSWRYHKDNQKFEIQKSE